MIAGLSCVAMAFLCWPSPPRAAVVQGPRRKRPTLPTLAVGRLGIAAGGAGAVVTVAMAWSPTGALVVAVLVGTGAALLGWAAADRRQRRDLVELTGALRMLGRELRSGASAEHAVAVCLAATDGEGRRGRDGPVDPPDDPRSSPASRRPPALGSRPATPTDRRGLARSRSVTQQVLRELVLPAEPSAGPAAVGQARQGRSGRRRRPTAVDDLVVRLVGGWRLAMRCGLPLTGLIEGVTAVAQEQVDALDARRAEVAGPRLSGWVLAALPAMGLLLGTGMGADPLALLVASSGAGPLLLIVGCALTCAGLLWSARIVRR